MRQIDNNEKKNWYIKNITVPRAGATVASIAGLSPLVESIGNFMLSLGTC